MVVANAKDAYIYSVSEKNIQLNLINKLTHIESQFKTINLISDRPGHDAKGYGNKLRGSYSQMTDPKLLKIKHFVKEICQLLENGLVKNCYVGIVANSHFYGLIKQLSSKHLIKHIKFHMDKNYANMEDKQLQPILQNSLNHELKLMFINSI